MDVADVGRLSADPAQLASGCQDRVKVLPAQTFDVAARAFADGELHPAERQVLAAVAHWMGLGEARFDTLLGMFSAQYGFSQSGRVAPGHGTVEEAYQALGVNASSSDREVKQAYRRLMSQHHPDKLIAQGVPEDMVRVATEKSQEIRAAYDTICKVRGL